MKISFERNRGVPTGLCTDFRSLSLFPVALGLVPRIQADTVGRSNAERLAVEPWALGSSLGATEEMRARRWIVPAFPFVSRRKCGAGGSTGVGVGNASAVGRAPETSPVFRGTP